jgi:hypothetical protein
MVSRMGAMGRPRSNVVTGNSSELSDLVRRGLVNPRRLSDPLYATRIRQQLTRHESGVVVADGLGGLLILVDLVQPRHPNTERKHVKTIDEWTEVALGGGLLLVSLCELAQHEIEGGQG